MMPVTLFKSLSYPSQTSKGLIQVQFAENTSKQIQPHDIDASTRTYNILKIQIMLSRSVLGCPGES